MTVYFQGSELEALWPNPGIDGFREVAEGETQWARRSAGQEVPGWIRTDAGQELEVAWHHFYGDATSANAVQGGRVFAWWTSENETEIICRLKTQTGAYGQLEYWTGSAFVQVGVLFDWNSGASSTFDLRIEYADGQHILELYRDEVMIAQKNTGGEFLQFGGSQKGFFTDTPAVAFVFGQHIIADVSTIDWNLLTVPPGTLGGDADGAGLVTDVNEAQINNNTFISFATPGQRSSFKAAARALANEIKAVTVAGRLRRADESAPDEVKPYLKIAGTRYYGTTYTLTMGYENFEYTWNLNPSTGLEWTPAEVNDANLEWGWEVV